MKHFLNTIFFLLIHCASNLIAQDTISIYFEFGKSELPEEQTSKLYSIPKQFDLSEVDSISFIGLADSIGDIMANLKLSEKRAKNTAEYCKTFIPKNIKKTITAFGETTKFSANKSRRVDVVFYSKKMEVVVIEELKDTIAIVENVCYNVDYRILHRLHSRTVVKNKKQFVMVEISPREIKKKADYYYGTINEKGKFVPQRIKWQTKRTGNFWWAKNRSVATIPKKNFDAYKIFHIDIPPCDTCNEDFKKTGGVMNADTCLQVERFLMENLQLKPRIFNNEIIKIRVPREYVIIEEKYFIGCDVKHRLLWEEKKGRKKRKYYYAKLPRSFNYIENISRQFECCKYKPEPSECKKGIICCKSLGEVDGSLTLNAEAGGHYQMKEPSPYISLGLSKEGRKSRLSLLTGIDNDVSFYGSLRYQYHFLSFPFNAINPISTWKSPGETFMIHHYARLYAGIELKCRIANVKPDYLEQNIHIGFTAVNTKERGIIQRIFIQYGFGYDYLSLYSKNIYPLSQLGITMRVMKFKI